LGIGLHGGGLGGGEIGLLLLDRGTVVVGFDADEQFALLDRRALAEGELNDFAGDFGAIFTSTSG